MFRILFSFLKTFNGYSDINNLCAMYQNKPHTMGILKLFYDEIVIAKDILAEAHRSSESVGRCSLRKNLLADAPGSVNLIPRRPYGKLW